MLHTINVLKYEIYIFNEIYLKVNNTFSFIMTTIKFHRASKMYC